MFAFVDPTLGNKIKDFNVEDDRIRLDPVTFVGVELGVLDDSQFKIGKQASTEDQIILYQRGKGNVWFDQDGSGDVYDPIKFAKIDKGLDLTAHNFFSDEPVVLAIAAAASATQERARVTKVTAGTPDRPTLLPRAPCGGAQAGGKRHGASGHHHLVGGPNVSPVSDLQSALAGAEGPAPRPRGSSPTAAGNKVVFTGTFSVVGGVVQDGTVTGFDLFDGAVKVMTGSGYALSDEAILKAHDAAIADDYTVFYPTFFSEVRAVGSADTDRMYGATEKGKFLGMAGDDFLYGDTGNEVMKGGLGDDWVEGRGAADKLFGDEGADTFAFTNADKGNDPTAEFSVHRIKDFDRGRGHDLPRRRPLHGHRRRPARQVRVRHRASRRSLRTSISSSGRRPATSSMTRTGPARSRRC